MKLSVEQLHAITGHSKYAGRKEALIGVLGRAAQAEARIARPHDLAQLFGQVMHESLNLRYTHEVWGPSRAQRRYEGRRDLGNTIAGDGFRMRGRDYIQITGRANYRALTGWAQTRWPEAPDFEATPDALAEPEWLGMGVIWYWTSRVPQRFVDAGNIEMVTRRVNGGLNGYAHRLQCYDRAALVLLGYGPTEVRQFQHDRSLAVDGVSGPVTRARMHKALKALPPLNAQKEPSLRNVFRGWWV